jgi:hypothetical protein
MEPAERWLTVAAAFYIALIILFLFTIPVRAQEHRHPPQHEALHHKFYKHWKMPTNRAVSCCNDQDCKPAKPT